MIGHDIFLKSPGDQLKKEDIANFLPLCKQMTGKSKRRLTGQLCTKEIDRITGVKINDLGPVLGTVEKLYMFGE